MLTLDVIETLNLIFSDSDLIDIDLSCWDEKISLYLIADHIPPVIKGMRSLMAVRFYGVKKIEWKFNHLKKEPGCQCSYVGRLNWNIYKFKLLSGKRQTLIMEGSPHMSILA